MLMRIQALVRPTLRERIDDLIKRVADLRGEIESWRVQHDYHCEQASHTDPNVDWWGFAHHKQKCHDANIEMAALNTKAAALASKLEELVNTAHEHVDFKVVEARS
jgi:hypothetical protein